MKDVITISQAVARQIVKGYKGSQFFSVGFIKRGDGSLRNMNCRKGVKKGLSGKGQKYNPASKNLVCVYDVKIEEPRMITLDNIKTISMRGRKYKVNP